jgi:hypothetical protein
MSYYPVLNLPRRRSLGDGLCLDLMSDDVATPAMAAALATWTAVKNWNLQNNQLLTSVFNQTDAAEFASLYTYALASEAGIAAIQTRIAQDIVNNNFCLTAPEGALVTEFGTKTTRLKALMAKVTTPGSPGGNETVGTGPEKIVVFWPGGTGQQQPQGPIPTQNTPPQTDTAAAAAKTKADEDAKKKELTKNLLIGGGILAAIGTGIWALVKK